MGALGTNLIQDFEPRLKLPSEQAQDGDVDADVRSARPILAFLHLGHKCSRHGPEDRDTSASEQVRAGE